MRKRFEDLTAEQQAVVGTWGKGQAVLAGAGSGKTTTLVVKCEALLQKNPEARFAAVSFTEKSASELHSSLSERGLLSDSRHGHWVTTIHGLCSLVLREFPRQAGLDGEETVLTEAEASLLWKQVLQGFWFQELQPEILEALEFLLKRETRAGVISLLERVKALHGFGVLERLSGDPDSQALARLGRYAMERYRQLKRRRGSLDFDDLEEAADRVLEFPEARAFFQKRFDLVLIDEFQDTNPVQASILWRFVRPDLSNVCVVGDPKQSIYRFRDADVTVFREYCSKLPIQQSLTWNFRSRPGIVDYVNRVCVPVFEASGMPYEKLVARREPDPSTQPVLRLELQHPEGLAAWIRAEQNRGARLGEMALLLRKIRGNEKWLRPLAAAGIPFAVGSGGFFWEDPRVRELVAALSWWENPAYTLSGATFLRAPWMGIPDPTLDQWVREDPTWEKPFLASEHPVAQALKPLREAQLSPGEFLMHLLVNDAIEEELGAPLLGLWHRVEDLSAAGMDFHAVVSEIRESVENRRKEREVPPPENEGQLRVLTLHGSKGLEFPTVILADFSSPWRPPNAPLLFWDRNRGAYLGKRDEEGERAWKTDPVETDLRREEKDKDLCESKRLFYVALTRARDRLVIACLPPPPRKKPIEEPLKTDFWRGWIDSVSDDVPRAKPDLNPEGPGSLLSDSSARRTEAQAPAPRNRALTGNAPTSLLQRPRHSVTEWLVFARCPRAYEWTYIRPRKEVRESFGLSISSTPGMDPRELGTRVHAVLEKAARLSDGDLLQELRALEQEAGTKRFKAEPVAFWTRKNPFMLSHESREVWTELGFEIPIRIDASRPPEVLIGSIDRVVCDRVGAGAVYRLVDFKVTTRAKSPEQLLATYAPQIHLYAWALTRLEPEARNALSAGLVNLHSGGVQDVEVPLPAWIHDAERAKTEMRDFVSRIDRVIQGEPGASHPGMQCGSCDHREACPEARKEADPSRGPEDGASFETSFVLD